MGELKPLLLSVEGRINRARFWAGAGVLAAFYLGLIALNFAVAAVFGAGVVTQVAAIVSLVPCLALVWPLVALGRKRFHDRDKSGWWVLIGLVPVVGGLWYLIECGFLEGTKGPNAYGPDPLAAA